MKHYAVAELEVTDPSWVQDYVERRDADGRGPRRALPGADGPGASCSRASAPAADVVLIEWPSREAAEEFFESEEYRPYREARRAGSRGVFLLVARVRTSTVAPLRAPERALSWRRRGPTAEVGVGGRLRVERDEGGVRRRG